MVVCLKIGMRGKNGKINGWEREDSIRTSSIKWSTEGSEWRELREVNGGDNPINYKGGGPILSTTHLRFKKRKKLASDSMLLPCFHRIADDVDAYRRSLPAATVGVALLGQQA